MKTKLILASLVTIGFLASCDGNLNMISITDVKGGSLPESEITFESVTGKNTFGEDGMITRVEIKAVTSSQGQNCTLQYPNPTCPQWHELTVSIDTLNEKADAIQYTVHQGNPENTYDISVYCPNEPDDADCAGVSYNLSTQTVEFNDVKLSNNIDDIVVALNLKFSGNIRY